MKRFWTIIPVFLFILGSCTQGEVKLNRVKGLKGPNHPVVQSGEASFKVSAPKATLVTIAGNFNGWNAQVTPMTKNTNGIWSVKMSLKKGMTYYYKYVIDGFWIADPDNPATAPDGKGGVNSVLKTK